MKPRRRPLLAGLAAACCAAVVLVLVWHSRAGEDHSEVVATADSPQGWQVVEYDDVQVTVPPDWVRVDMSECEFEYERWAPAGTDACDYQGGVAFYASATFDPAHGPGVRRSTEDGEETWAGYVDAGDYAVYVADPDRDVTRSVLDSVR